MSQPEPLSPEERRQMKARLTAAAEYPGPLPAHPSVRLALENGLWLLEQNEALAARVSSLEAGAQEVRRAWDAMDEADHDCAHGSYCSHRSGVVAAIDALVPPVPAPPESRYRCSLGGCEASLSDGIVCPPDECDWETGVRGPREGRRAAPPENEKEARS